MVKASLSPEIEIRDVRYEGCINSSFALPSQKVTFSRIQIFLARKRGRSRRNAETGSRIFLSPASKHRCHKRKASSSVREKEEEEEKKNTVARTRARAEEESPRWNSDETGSDTTFLPTRNYFRTNHEGVASRRETLIQK